MLSSTSPLPRRSWACHSVACSSNRAARYQRPRAQGLASALVRLAQGDTCNLLGCILADNQLPTQTFTAVYFILTDM